MTANKYNDNLVLFDNMRFGEMINAGWNFKGTNYWAALNEDGTQKHLTNLDPKALKLYEPLINDYIINHCFMYYPAQDDLNVFAILLNHEIVSAVLDQAPVLSFLAYPELMPDHNVGQAGVMNIQDNGTEGKRYAEFGTQFPQAMLDGNIGDYGSDGNANSHKIEKYKPSLDAIKEFDDLQNAYKDALHRIGDAVEQSGVFSSFIY